MLFGKSSIPVRIQWIAGDYNTTLGVKAEIYSEGTSSGGETLLETVTLTNQGSGRYSNLYTPLEGYDRLIINYLVYTDVTYGTLDLAYPPVSEQMVINSGVGSLGGGGGSVTIHQITDKEKEEIAKMVWELSLTEENASEFINRIIENVPLIDNSDFLKRLDIQIKDIELKLKKINLDNTKVVDSLVLPVKKLLIESIDALNSNISKYNNDTNSSLSGLLDKNKKEFEDVGENVSKINEKQIKNMIDFVKNDLITMILDINKNYLEKTIDVIADIIQNNTNRSLNYNISLDSVESKKILKNIKNAKI